MENSCCFLSKNKHQRYLLIIFCILLIFFPKFNLNQILNKKETTKLFNFVVFATIKQQNKQKINQKIEEEEELIDKISKLGLEAEDNNNNNNLVDDKTILNNKKIKRRQINNLKEKRKKEWENEIIKELKNSEKSEEGKEENFVTIWRLFNLCTNDFVKIQKVGKINKILVMEIMKRMINVQHIFCLKLFLKIGQAKDNLF
uniref:Uncharacterized protein n=1 Tax=Meloidogyne enterolobii TaxID=390850 RepID=A0A6V7TVF3_MELEN|nr:unnamed protein product [Meloidogyne enterolobii]